MSRETNDIAGQRFGSLVALDRARNAHGRLLWRCVCDCGGETLAQAWGLLHDLYIDCGCNRLARQREYGSRNRRHGCARVGKRTPEYTSWRSMMNRCRNPHEASYAKYGARGITVCDRWLRFDNFIADMGARPPGTTIDRFPDNAGNYEPSNCRWATAIEQVTNRRVTLFISKDGRTQSLAAWARELGMRIGSIHARLDRGWSPEQAISAPIGPWRGRPWRPAHAALEASASR